MCAVDDILTGAMGNSRLRVPIYPKICRILVNWDRPPSQNMRSATGCSMTLSLKSLLGNDQRWIVSGQRSSQRNCSNTGTLSSISVCSVALTKHLVTCISRRLVADTRSRSRSMSLEMRRLWTNCERRNSTFRPSIFCSSRSWRYGQRLDTTSWSPQPSSVKSIYLT
jgi:hypothetical protein